MRADEVKPGAVVGKRAFRLVAITHDDGHVYFMTQDLVCFSVPGNFRLGVATVVLEKRYNDGGR